MDAKVNKIVIISAYPFNQRDYLRFGVETLRDNGFFVEIWDISTWLLKRKTESAGGKNRFTCEDLRFFSNKNEIVSAIESMDSGCLVNCIIEFSIQTFFIFSALSKKHIRYCVFGMTSFPNPYPEIPGRIRGVITVIRRAGSLKISEVVQQFFNSILRNYYHFFGIRPAAIILRSGERSTGNFGYPIDATTTQLWAHMLDYDIYLKNPALSGDTVQKNGVFLDDYLPLHPDHIYSGIDYALSPDPYYQKLCSFFKTLETSLKTQVIVAAHPRSEYENLPDYFEGRLLIKGETARLVRESAFVIAHMSTAINFAVLYKKPIVFITNDELENLTTGKNLTGLYIRAIAAELGKKPINIDHYQSIDWNKELSVNEQKYQQYKNLYIKREGTPVKPVWEIFCDHLRSMENP